MAEVPARARDLEVRRYLTFRSGAQSYALPAEEVAEIILLPPLARLPQCPAALLGMANLRGSVIPVASLRALLGQVAGPVSARAILLGGAAPVAISVDQVDTLVSLDATRVKISQTELGAQSGEFLRGAFQSQTGGNFTKILDLQPLLAAAFTQTAKTARAGATRAVRGQAKETGVQTACQLLVSFQVAGQDYALPLDEVQEIIPLPAAIAKPQRGDATLLGIVDWRGNMLPLLSLRGLLGFPLCEAGSGQAKIIVISYGPALAGLVADAANAVVPAPISEVQPAPAMLVARMGGESRIRATYRDPQSGKIFSVLAADRLLGAEITARLANAVTAPAALPGRADKTTVKTRQFLVFRLGAEEFGLPIEAVDEVAAAPDKITRLPKTPKFLEGVVNLRGDVLPVIDQRRRFEMPSYEGPAGLQRLVVARSQRHRAGLRVDSISGVLGVAEAEIEAAPSLTGETTHLVTGVLNLGEAGRIVLLLNPDELLSRAERGLLDNFAAAQKQEG